MRYRGEVVDPIQLIIRGFAIAAGVTVLLSLILFFVDQRATGAPDILGRVYVFSEERIPIVNRETGKAEQKIILQYAINGATYFAELDDEEELARYYKYLRDVDRGR